MADNRVLSAFEKTPMKNKELKAFLIAGFEHLYPTLNKEQEKVFWDLVLTFIHKLGKKGDMESLKPFFSGLQAKSASTAKSVGHPSAFAPVGGVSAKGVKGRPDDCPDCPKVPDEVVIAGLGSPGAKKEGKEKSEKVKASIMEIVEDFEEGSTVTNPPTPEWDESPEYDDPEHPEDAESLAQLRRIVRVGERPGDDIVAELKEHMKRAKVEYNTRLSNVDKLIEEFYNVIIKPRFKS